MISKLIEEATKVSGVYKFNTYYRNYAGRVGCALLTRSGNIYTGVSVDLVCGLGNCAEYSAICEMVKNHESEIEMIVSVYEGNKIIPPCGRCRELISQLDLDNENTVVAINNDQKVTLKELLPERWDKKWD